MTKRTLVFDTEGDGLYHQMTRLHCLACVDYHTGEAFDFRPWELEEGVRFLMEEAEVVVGHNIIGHDIKAIQKVYPWYQPPAEADDTPLPVLDTLLMSRRVRPAEVLLGPDIARFKKGLMPPEAMKRHSLAAWGYRLGNYKGDYHGPWDVWSETMHSYMIQDVAVNVDLYRYLRRAVGWEDPAPQVYVWPTLPFEVEFGAATIVTKQEDVGVALDRDEVVALGATITQQREEVGEKLKRIFGAWVAPTEDREAGHVNKKARQVKRREFKDVRMPRFGVRGQRLADYVGPPLETHFAGARSVRVEYVNFKPSSRPHLAKRLQDLYGWKPRHFGKDGKPKLDEDTINDIPPEIIPDDLRELLLAYFTMDKVLGIILTGGRSWLNTLWDDGRSHPQINVLGAVTGRATHSNPNITLTPKVQTTKDKPPVVLKGLAGGFGWECRHCWKASEGRELTGTDGASLELMILGHYLAPYDNGRFAAKVGDPSVDPHEENAKLTGENRNDTKTVTYLTIYGGGSRKAGKAMSLLEDEIAGLLTHPKLDWLVDVQRRMDGPDWVEMTDKERARLAKGYRVIQAFLHGIPGIKDLKKDVTEVANRRGWLKTIDGGQVFVRKAHASLNTLLQSAGAIICKLWMVTLDRMLRIAGVSWEECWQVIWAHDELQFDHRPGLGPLIKELSNAAIKEVGERLRFRGALRTDAKTDHSWAGTH